jgi:hypothetical protein
MSNVIDKFPFASDGNATDVGDITLARTAVAGQSSLENGYLSGGTTSVNLGMWHNSSGRDEIDKFPFASDANATDVGDLAFARHAAGGQSSTTHGYTSGGTLSNNCNQIDKFPFASDGNATDVGDIVAYQGRGQIAAQSSDTSGYTSGGRQPTGGTDVIDKFPFASDGNATDVGELLGGSLFGTGQSSTASGYVTGGCSSGPSNSCTIQKFPFASDNPSSGVGNLTHVRRCGAAGQQV